MFGYILPAGTQALYDYMACTTATGDTINEEAATIQAPNGPYAANSTPIYQCQIVDMFGVGVPAAAFSYLCLTIYDVATGTIINNCNHVNILNVGRGTIDAHGNLVLQLQTADTDTSDSPGSTQVERAILIGWSFSTETSGGSGQHQVNFIIQAFPFVVIGAPSNSAIIAGVV